jgi:hypothetical protein
VKGRKKKGIVTKNKKATHRVASLLITGYQEVSCTAMKGISKENVALLTSACRFLI